MATEKERIIKLQGINALIAGVRSAPPEMPGALTSEMLPCALTYPGPGTHSVPFYSGRRTDRIYVVRLYVQPVGQGEGVDAGFQVCLPFLDSFPDEYHTTTIIAPADETWQELDCENDTGVRADLTLHGAPGGQTYWGIVFSVRIKVKAAVV